MPVQRRTAAPASSPATRGRAAGPASAAAQAPTPNNQGGGFASLNPQDFTQGGLLDDVDVIFVSCRFVEWDYDGKIDHPVLALAVEMSYDDSGKPATVVQYYSAGETNRFVPSEDGRHATSVGGAKSLANSTNAAMLLKSVIDAGFPVDKFGDGDIGMMDGMFCHINRVPQPKRGGNISNTNDSGYEKTVAIVTKIHQLPWETKGAPGKGSAGRAKGGAAPAASRQPSSVANAPSAAPSDADAGEVELTEHEQEAAPILLTILEENGGKIAKTAIASKAFKHVKDLGNRKEVLAALANAEFLAVEGLGWTFDGKTIEAA